MQRRKDFLLLEVGIIGYHSTQVFDFLVGTVLIKYFYFDHLQLKNQKNKNH
tara:strand:+ start:106 stop:258 length:153 start_codon:yes stop_codon:yes gene_type:complete